MFPETEMTEIFREMRLKKNAVSSGKKYSEQYLPKGIFSVKNKK